MGRTYQLYIRLKKKSSIKVGRLGKFDFPAGLYVYTGSAKTNMEKRIARHRSQKKKLRWHIDYLLANINARVSDVKISVKGECPLNSSTKGKIIVKGFGASDCRKGCGAHLKYLG